MKIWTRILVGLALLMLVASSLPAQSISATLTGVVSDPSNAVVPQAQVKLRNESSGSERVTTTNNEGYFTFASVDTGDFTYELSVTAKGFLTYKAPGIALSGSEKRNVNVGLKVGSTTEVVEVTGVADSLVPVDSGEKSSSLTTKELQNYSIVSSNAAEFIKIMPGFGINNGTSNKANYTGEVIGINANGDGGSQSPLNNAYSYNGLPGNSLDITADGAHVSDPGCNCDTPVNPNADMVAEVKVLTSNFSAENSKGPIVFSSVAKSGGRDFHGEAYFYARNYALNANDWLNNKSGVKAPENKYYFPGGNVGGPVFIPGHLNKNRDKLFFFTGYEFYYQVLDTGLLRATVPTSGMIGGDYTPTELAKLGTITSSGAAPSGISSTKFPTGVIPAAQIDPNTQALMKLYPQPNADSNSTGGYNYVQAETFNQNNMQWMTRVDYSISDNTKLYLRYNMQRETQQFPVGLWWRNSLQVPYPTPVQGKNRSDSVTASLTHVFSPTMTNEFVFGYSFIGFPNIFEDPSKVDRTKVGYSYTGIFHNGVAQIPSFGAGGAGNSEMAYVFNPGGFEAGGPSSGLYANKYMPSVSDNLSKVWGTHTVKAGFYYEWIRNAQPANNDSNGQLNFYEHPSTANLYTSGNPYADMLLGILNGYDETSFNRINDIAFTEVSGFVQDSWKVNKKLTVDLGLRITHFTPWVDRLGDGYSIFNASLFNPSCAGTYCGFEWHKAVSSVPLGGFPTRAAFYQPRFGVAYDLFGKGNTVIRGGWGRYYYHAGQFTNGLDASAGVKSIGIGSTNPNVPGTPMLASELDSLNISAVASGPSAVDGKDDKQAHTDSYSFTVAQKTPWSGLLEVSYVGNMSRDIPASGNGGSLGFNTLNINLVPVGALLNHGSDPNGLIANNYRPLLGYSDLYVATNNGYSNYNALQMTWLRSKGRYNINLNYTFGKALGITGFYDQFNLNNDYGVLANNRTQIFNAAYSLELGSPLKGNKIAGGFVNGWQLSGITQLESGPNLSALQGENFGLGINGNLASNGYALSSASLLGTPDIQLGLVETCNPTSGLAAHQYINPKCFGLPTTVGANGGTVLPPIYGPSFFNWDLGLFKNFNIKESKKIQIRFNAYNWLNHPLYSFNGSNLNIQFNAAGTQTNPNFGTTTDKQGHRVLQLAAKFYF